MSFGKEIIFPYNVFCLLITLLLVVLSRYSPTTDKQQELLFARLPQMHVMFHDPPGLVHTTYYIDGAMYNVHTIRIAKIIGHFTVLSNCYSKKD